MASASFKILRHSLNFSTIASSIPRHTFNPYNTSRFTTFVRNMSSIAPEILSSKFHKFQVVPDVIPVAPIQPLNVWYDKYIFVAPGNELTPTQVQNAPTKVLWEADSDSFYTLCMTDPDAPTRSAPQYREWHHWLVVNIPGNDLRDADVLSEYIGAGPPPNTGLHRYVFLVYKQPGELKFDEPRLTNRSQDNRACFKISEFAAKYKLGDPIAGTFFEAEYDDYVPTLYKQLGA